MAENGGGSSSTARTTQTATYLFHTFVVVAVLCALSAGCKKSRPGTLEPEQIHAITEEFAAAASSAGPRGTNVWIARRASSEQPNNADGVAISVPLDLQTENGRAAEAKLLRAIGAVATKHRLAQDPEKKSANSVKLVFRRAGTATHEIEITSRAAHASGEGVHAQLAIILDDLGNDPAAAKAIFALPYPLTISVLPNHAHSADIAEEAHRRGYGVMLHLPMQAVGKEQPEAEELRPGMSAQEVRTLANEMIGGVPYAAGVNNHQGSQATADASLMEDLMPVLRERGLFYVDSRTTAATVAYDTARKDEVKTGFRNVPFLDDVEETGAIRKQLEIAMRGAIRKGEAIAIGHPHPQTIQALSEILPKAKEQGIKLVLVSELVH